MSRLGLSFENRRRWFGGELRGFMRFRLRRGFFLRRVVPGALGLVLGWSAAMHWSPMGFSGEATGPEQRMPKAKAQSKHTKRSGEATGKPRPRATRERASDTASDKVNVQAQRGDG